MTGDKLLVLARQTMWSPHDPKALPRSPDYVPNEHYNLWIYGGADLLLASFHESVDERGILELWEVEVRGATGGNRFSVFYNRNEPCKSVRHDGELLVTATTDAEIALRRRSLPDFGEYEDLLLRMRTALEVNGLPRFA